MLETILIADDHESSLAGLAGLLELEGFRSITARPSWRARETRR